jgi:hypothetical protein
MALAFLVSLASAGSRYFYCPFMDAVVSEHCCAGRSADRVSTAEQPDCCEVRILSGLPAARAGNGPPELPVASLVAVIAPIADRSSSALSPTLRPLARSGLSPPKTRHAAQLMVLRI